jgi:hypothetical protein
MTDDDIPTVNLVCPLKGVAKATMSESGRRPEARAIRRARRSSLDLLGSKVRRSLNEDSIRHSRNVKQLIMMQLQY